MERGKRNEPRTLDNIINNELEELSTLKVTKYAQKIYIKRTLYYEQLKRYYSLFPRENIFIFNIHNYNLEKLYNFIGIEFENYNEENIFKRVGTKKDKKDKKELMYLQNHKKLQELIYEDKTKLKEHFNIII